MLSHFLRISVRSFSSNKKFSIISITGFAFAFSVCVAISLYIINEHSYDRYNTNVDQIVRVINTADNSSQIDYRVRDILKNNFPGIKNACLTLNAGRPVEAECEGKGYYLDDIMSVDNNFFEVFTVPFISGQPSPVFTDINSAVITESTAKKLFGSDSPLGKKILIWGIVPVTVSGIIRDFPENSSLNAEILVNADNIRFKFNQWIGDSRDSSTYWWPFQVYLQLERQVDPQQLAAKINEDIVLLKPYLKQADFLQLKDIYLHDPTTDSNTKKGNPGLLNLLSVIALIILILAVINYLNLTLAQQAYRNKETGIRKVFGANRDNVINLYLFESVVVITAAFFLGILFLCFMLPFYNDLFNSSVSISLIFSFPYIIILPAVILFIGLISGAGPAIVLSGISPIRILTGSVFSQGSKNYLRNALIIFQFAISIILIFSVITVERQILYVKNKNPGFNEKHLLRIDLPMIRTNDINKAFVFLDELRMLPQVENISLTSGVPGEIRMSMGSNMENTDRNTSVPCLLVDTSFIKTFGLKVVRGRNLLPGDIDKVCMINEAAYAYFEFEDLYDKRFNNFGGFDIIGVVNDFHFSSLHKTIGPVCIMFTSRNRPSAISIRFRGSATEPGLDQINHLWQEILPGYPLKYQYYDEWFDSMYRSEEYFARTISLFALLAIVISCIGILGLAIFSSERRTKEIGIRKICGSNVSDILNMLNSEFLRLVLISFVIAVPVSWLVMTKWLEDFAYRTELSWWIFLLSGMLAIIIAIITVSWQSWRAATRNPVEALRYE